MTDRIEQTVPYSVQAADIVRSRILGGEYAPGQRLSEVELSASLGMSRSPLREALRLLANEGLVKLVSGRGVSVADFSETEVRELVEIREALDVLAVRLAAERATTAQIAMLRDNLEGLTNALRTHGTQTPEWPSDFHLCIYEVAGNSRLKEHGFAVHTSCGWCVSARARRRIGWSRPTRSTWRCSQPSPTTTSRGPNAACGST